MTKIDLSRKVALVTGAASGIGASIALRFAAYNAAVLVTDVVDGGGAETAKRIKDNGGKAHFALLDVRDEAHWQRAVTGALNHFGSLDIVVNNAAIEKTAHLEDVEVDQINDLLAVNVVGTILGHKHAIRAMRPGGPAGRGGSIVNLSSIAGLIGTPGLGVYSASKGAVRLLTKVAAVECGRLGYGIRVNSIHPGLVKTGMGDKIVEDFVALGVLPPGVDANAAITSTYPIGRTGTTQDIASAALFLVSDLSSWITGAELVVDGGLTVS